MNIKEALNLFEQNNKKGLVPTEYCVVNEGIVINTESPEPRPESSPAQYLVTNDGKVYATNPMMVEYTEFYKINKGDSI